MSYSCGTCGRPVSRGTCLHGRMPAQLARGAQQLAGNEDALLDYWRDKICETGGFDDCTDALAGKVDDENKVCGWLKAQLC